MTQLLFKIFFSVSQFSWESVLGGCHFSIPLDFYGFGDSQKATTSTRLGCILVPLFS